MTYDFRQRRARDIAVEKAALEVYENLPVMLQHEVDGFLQGVFGGRAQSLESHADELYDAYTPVREVLRSKYGSRVTVFRGEPKDKPAIRRKFLSWTPSWKMAIHFATTRGYEVVEADVRTSDVVAVFFSPHNRGYVEYVVRDRKEYHERPTAEQAPLYGWVEVDRFGRDFGWDDDRETFSPDSVSAERPYLERELRAVGGALLQLNINEDDEWASADVALPGGVNTIETGNGTAAMIGPYTVVHLRPDPEGTWLPKGRAQRSLFGASQP